MIDEISACTIFRGVPFAFTGTLHRVVVDVSGERIEDHEAEIRMALARQ